MKRRLIFLGCFLANAAAACDRAICLSDEQLRLSDLVTFNDQPSGMGPGRKIDGLLHLPGASFGERFAGQSLDVTETFDLVTGPGHGPLDLLPGSDGHNLSILRLAGTNVLSGDGPTGFPRVDATGEGAMAILFTEDQSALRLVLRGGEGGYLTVQFLDRAGQTLDVHRLGPLSESTFDFTTSTTQSSIAGVVVTNVDPQGVALQEVHFGQDERLSKSTAP